MDLDLVQPAYDGMLSNTTMNQGTVTVHSDVTDPGSGSIITDSERTKLDGIEDSADVSTLQESL